MRRTILLVVTVAAALVLAVATPALACETGMWITSDPGSGGPGTVVTVRGGGWEPGSVTLRWDSSAESGGAVLAEAPVAPDGTIQTQVTIPEAAPGQHKIVAEHTQSAGEVTHAGDWSHFTIPGAAPAQEQPTQQQQQPQQAEQRERPTASSGAPEATAGASDHTQTVRVQPETVAAPSVMTPAEAAPAVEQPRAPKVQTGRLPLEKGPEIELARALREPAMVAAPRMEPAPAAGATERKDNPLPGWLAAAAGAALLAFIARRARRPRSTEAEVLGLPLAPSRQEERDAA